MIHRKDAKHGMRPLAPTKKTNHRDTKTRRFHEDAVLFSGSLLTVRFANINETDLPAYKEWKGYEDRFKENLEAAYDEAT